MIWKWKFGETGIIEKIRVVVACEGTEITWDYGRIEDELIDQLINKDWLEEHRVIPTNALDRSTSIVDHKTTAMQCMAASFADEQPPFLTYFLKCRTHTHFQNTLVYTLLNPIAFFSTTKYISAHTHIQYIFFCKKLKM